MVFGLRGVDLNLLKGKSFKVLVKLMRKIDEEKAEQRMWERWLVEFPYMTKETFMPFNEYYSQIYVPKVVKSSEEILAEVERIREKAGR